MGKYPKPERGTSLPQRREAAGRDWRTRLARELGAARRLFVLGVGNRDRADDGAGSLVARRLRRKLESGARSGPAARARTDDDGFGHDSEETPASPSDAAAPGRTPRGRLAPLIVRALDGGEVPENAAGAIRRFRPTHVLIIDAAAGGREPGSVFFIGKQQIVDEDLTTHRIPLSRLVRYLEESVGCRVVLVGIEPRRLSAGEPISGEVKAAVAAVVTAIAKTLRD